jgi:hypothetical protein
MSERFNADFLAWWQERFCTDGDYSKPSDVAQLAWDEAMLRATEATATRCAEIARGVNYGSAAEEIEMEFCVGRYKKRPAPPAPWQPIETAPKDGTVVLLLRAESQEPITAFWDPGVPPHVGSRGWTDNARESLRGFEATYWMPIPPPK